MDSLIALAVIFGFLIVIVAVSMAIAWLLTREW